MTAPPVAAAWAFCGVAVVLLLMPSVGGYGTITWALHPIFTLLGVFAVAPYGLFAYRESSGAKSREAARAAHGAAMAGAFLLMVLGAAVAWGVHASKGHAHFPALTKPLLKIAHVYGAYALLLAFAAQAVAGALKARSLAAGGGRVFPWHGAVGPALWAAAAAVAAGGLAIPFALSPNGNAPVAVLLVGGALAVAAAGVHALVFA